MVSLMNAEKREMAINLAVTATIKEYREREDLKMDDVADLMGIGPAVFRNKGNPRNNLAQLNLNEVGRMIELTGNDAIARVLIELACFSNKKAHTNIRKGVVQLVASSTEVLKTIDDALDDDDINDNEYTESLTAISKAMDGLKATLASVNQKYQSGKLNDSQPQDGKHA